ncbi:hypothetical protein NK118_14615 [Lachnospiraceae bacterium PAL227]|uniref:DUF7601 domain-containing protein n=3 Tax=Ohessyouella blattaphilus TaxID=2949333 RepID=A0ABT1ELX6_9FIRM|nr:FctA domain-containing protein [Ohessyouella blattaphilus]MCP1111484.1 hypothetical protein [Ohessyouella blattaphilus]MCR8564878.1 hypothetical protein [Ohessyouella blattaphilus]
MTSIMTVFAKPADNIPKDGNTSTTTVNGSFSDVTITKQLNIAEGTTVPSETFSFTSSLTAVTNHTVADTTYDGVKAIAISDITFSSADAIANDMVVKQSSPLFYDGSDNDIYTFPHAGEYIYEVSETAKTTTGMTYSTQSYIMRVYVKNTIDAQGNATGTEIYAVTVYDKQYDTDDSTRDAHKVDPTPNDTPGEGNGFRFVNTYIESAPFFVQKQVKGAYADMTKAFNFNVSVKLPSTFPVAADSAVYWKVEGSTGTPGTPTKVSITSEAKRTFVISTSLKHGEKIVFTDAIGNTVGAPVGTVYTVTESESDTSYTKTATVKEGGSDVAVTVDSEGKINESGDENFLVKSTTDTDGNTAIMTNTKVDISITGIVMNNLPFILLGLFSVAGVGLYLFGRTRRRVK